MKKLKMIKLVDFPEGLDEKNIIKHFFNLSQLEATKMIADETPYPCTVYTEDLMWMAEEGFAYYFPSYVAACKILHHQKGIEYVEDFYSGILTAIAFRAEEFPRSIENNKEIVIEYINFLETEAEKMLSDEVYINKILKIKTLLNNG